jgi:hypothetical protein
VNFKPTHEITTADGETIKIMLVGECAYQGNEWAESMAAEITNDGSWKRNGRPLNAMVKKANPDEPEDYR